MLKKRIFIAIIAGFLLIPTTATKAAYFATSITDGSVSLTIAPTEWDKTGLFVISAQTVKVFDSPEAEKPAFILYKGMEVQSQNIIYKDSVQLLQIKFGNKSYFIHAVEANGRINVTPANTVSAASISTVTEKSGVIIDYYGILDQPHRFAIKLVKEAGAKGRLETYEKTDNGYIFIKSYPVTYRKEGPKSTYGDLKSPGGPVIRYVYRTTNTSRGGRDAGQSFGGYKVSYPMPHDALPYLESGTMSPQEYNKIPSINENNGTLIPSPHSRLGADIVIHTDIWGSLGCITLNNKDMADLYLKTLVTANDKEIIPLVIYDENVVAPAEGQLFINPSVQSA